MNKFVIISLFFLIIAAYVAVSGLFSRSANPAKNSPSPTPTVVEEQIMCTLDAKICPDGSSVGRVPPSCEFAPCPESGTPAASGEAQLFQSEDLGISFNYMQVQNDEEVIVAQDKSTVHIFPRRLGIQGGQSVEVFKKSPADTLQQAIQKTLLANKNPADCVVLPYRLDPTYPQTYQAAEIGYPIEVPDIVVQEEMAQKCGAGYAKTNGIRYFLYNPATPDRFVFFTIGQYPILAAETIPWQNTLRIGQ